MKGVKAGRPIEYSRSGSRRRMTSAIAPSRSSPLERHAAKTVGTGTDSLVTDISAGSILYHSYDPLQQSNHNSELNATISTVGLMPDYRVHATVHLGCIWVCCVGGSGLSQVPNQQVCPKQVKTICIDAWQKHKFHCSKL